MKETHFDTFDKIYSCYYRVVKKILEEASVHPVTRKEESLFEIAPSTERKSP